MITPTCKPLAAVAIAGTDRLKLEQHYTELLDSQTYKEQASMTPPRARSGLSEKRCSRCVKPGRPGRARP